MITHILAYAQDSQGRLVLGLDNKLPWSIPEDLAFFKKATLGKTIYMGTNTFKSLFEYTPKGADPLPGRQIVVITSSVKSAYDLRSSLGFFSNVTYMTCDTLHQHVLLNSFHEFYIVGGATLYKEFPPDEILATNIGLKVEGDTYYPFDLNSFELVSSSSFTSVNKGTECFYQYFKRAKNEK